METVAWDMLRPRPMSQRAVAIVFLFIVAGCGTGECLVPCRSNLYIQAPMLPSATTYSVELCVESACGTADVTREGSTTALTLSDGSVVQLNVSPVGDSGDAEIYGTLGSDTDLSADVTVHLRVTSDDGTVLLDDEKPATSQADLCSCDLRQQTVTF